MAVVPSINLKSLTIPPAILKMLPAETMRRYTVLPFALEGDKLAVAIADPSNEKAIQEIKVLSGYEVSVFTADGPMILDAMERYRKIWDVSKPSGANPGTQIGSPTEIIDRFFEMALDQRASDIHFEPHPRAFFIRFRIDGVLKTVGELPRESIPAIVSRIKVMASMDIAEKRLPQDGQMSIKLRGRDVDLRISTIPGKHGEKVVIRLLVKSIAAFHLGRIGLEPVVQSQFEQMVDKPQGMILVTGPTGSGKSTTLYAVLTRLKAPHKNIITLEDPVEYELSSPENLEAGATQVQIHPKIGLTFASGLRACLRQDPDILMVGEIRDQETAEVALKAAMTGHLVISTLHTNSASESIGRLRDMGIDPYLIASTIIGVMAQRLVRVLCEHCKEPYQIPERSRQNIFGNFNVHAQVKLFRAKGCEKCGGSGYWGRQGIYELLSMSEELRELVHRQAPAREIKALAQAQGMGTLRESGLRLVSRGMTTVEEVFRNTVD